MALPEVYLKAIEQLVPGFIRSDRTRRQISRAETPVKQLQRQAITLVGQSGIVARPFISHKGVCSVHFVPLVVDVFLFEPRADQSSALEWYVRVLAPPDMQQLTLNVAGPRERIVVHAFA